MEPRDWREEELRPFDGSDREKPPPGLQWLPSAGGAGRDVKGSCLHQVCLYQQSQQMA